MAKTTLKRPPVVTVMGHVDHGKTTLLDAIKNTSVTEQEHGGITQQIGAYQVDTDKGKVTFIDTPGHAAFTEMRSRGGQIADVVILVVAADDGVKPQTIEAIEHAKAAEVPIIAVINKIDKEGADPRKAKQELADNGVLVEEYGGDVICVELSALKGQNLDKLLESVIALSELLELTADPNESLLGTIIESKKDKKKGVLVTILVQEGTLKVGMDIWAGLPGQGEGAVARVRQMFNHTGKAVSEGLPGAPVVVLGFKTVPDVGVMVVEKEYANKMESLGEGDDDTEESSEGYQTDKPQTLNLVIKADTNGVLEAIKGGVERLGKDGLPIKIISAGVGDLNESDVMLALASRAMIFTFGVSFSGGARLVAKQKGIPVREYNIIYELLDDLEKAARGALEEKEDRVKGLAEVLKVFPLPSGDVVAGCKVTRGNFGEGWRVGVWENAEAYQKAQEGESDLENAVYVGKIKKLRMGKEEVKKVQKSSECGMLFSPGFKEVSPGQIVQAL